MLITTILVSLSLSLSLTYFSDVLEYKLFIKLIFFRGEQECRSPKTKLTFN